MTEYRDAMNVLKYPGKSKCMCGIYEALNMDCLQSAHTEITRDKPDHSDAEKDEN